MRGARDIVVFLTLAEAEALSDWMSREDGIVGASKSDIEGAVERAIASHGKPRASVSEAGAYKGDIADVVWVV